MAEGTENQETKTNNETKRVLTFKPGEEYKIKVETAEEFKESLFKGIYVRAGRNLKSIIEENIKDKKRESNWKDKKCREEETFFKDSYNNIIAFIGERGTGKSSSMISFAKAIKNIDTWGKEEVIDEKVDSFLKEKKCRFESIGVIDPSMFEEKDNILEIVIAKMFHHFNEWIEQPCSDAKYPGKRELLKAFQKVYENLKTIQKEKHERLDSEVIEALSNLASGSNLKKSIMELVEEYLKFMGNENCNTYFLLVIDDFDLNIKHAGEMAEQIRKYLVIPGVIILLAVKLDQLSSIIEQTYREKFRTMLDDKVKRMSSVEPQIMAYLYIEKLIPEDRRLYLPEIRKIENRNIQIGIEPEPEKIPKRLEDTILELIYMKTGLIFLKQAYEFHFLIPDNLRDLHSVYVMLNSLENVDISEPQKLGEKEKRMIKNNLQRFEDYFFNTWIMNNLSLTDQIIIEEFLSVDIRQKNKFIITSICSKHDFNSTKLEGEKEDVEEFQRIVSKENKPLNVSLGDVLFFLYKVLLYDDSFNTKRFVFAVKTIYSLTFYKLLFIEMEYENVQLLLGGSVYNPENIQLIRKSTERKRRDHYDEIDYSKAKEHFIEKGFLNPEWEWIHYFLKYLGEKNAAYRKVKDLHYDNSTNLTIPGGAGKIKYATFDVLAFVCFVYNPRRMLQRIYGEDKMEETYISYVVKKWRDKYRSVLPINSIEFLEKILQFDLIVLKREAGGYHDYFLNFLKNLRNSIDNILKNNNHVNGKVILDAYDECPVIPKVKDAKMQRFTEEQIGLVNKLFGEEEPQKPDKGEKSQLTDKGKKTQKADKEEPQKPDKDEKNQLTGKGEKSQKTDKEEREKESNA